MRISLQRVLRGESPGRVAQQDHGFWYRGLFAPGVEAGLVPAESLAGYRADRVLIRGSRHVPPDPAAVRGAMPVLFDLMTEEDDPAVRAVLGHYIFVYIHPYADGNGRIARFLMNVMLAADGYPWTVVPVERRESYMRALEAASVAQDIAPFATFLADFVEKQR